MTGFVQILRCFCCLAVRFHCPGAWLRTRDDFDAGPAYAEFALTLRPGWREEAAGPFYYSQTPEARSNGRCRLFFARPGRRRWIGREWDMFYPVLELPAIRTEYRCRLAQLLSLFRRTRWRGRRAAGDAFSGFISQQRSPDTNLNYTALVPFYGHLKNRLFRDEINFVLFPLYSETRKKDVVTDNYLYPIFDLRHGDHMTGWQVWPLAGAEHKAPTLRTNSLDEVATNGGYEKFFALWPIYFKSRLGLGTTNPQQPDGRAILQPTRLAVARPNLLRLAVRI